MTTKKLAGNAVATSKLKNGAVSAAKIAPGAVGSTALATGAVDGAALAPGAVGGAALAPGAVSTVAIADDAVTGDKVDESTLGTVPSAVQAENASELNGIGPDGFIQGSGSSFAHIASDEQGGGHAVSIPGIGELLNLCASAGQSGPVFQSTAEVEVLAWGLASRDTGSGATTSIDFESLTTTQELDLAGTDAPGSSHFELMLRPAETTSGLPRATIEVALEATAQGCEWLTTVTILG